MSAQATHPPLPAEAVTVFRARMAELREVALSGRGGTDHARAVSDAYDALVEAHVSGCLSRWSGGRGRGRVALMAVGGYGRRQLSPGSDLDLVLLAERPESPPVRDLAEAMLYPLWDAKITVGHSVHDVDGLIAEAKSDLRTRTMLLDLRFLAGDRGLADALRERSAALRGERELATFIDALADELRERHERFGATVYLLEPDVKLGRGGLRDLDIIRWALRARVRADDFGGALGSGALSQPEHDALEAAREFHLRLRAALHARAGRKSDRVTFDAQEECAQALGFFDPAEAAVDLPRAVAFSAERLMSEFYRHARGVASMLPHVLARCRPSRAPEHPRRPLPLAEGVTRFDGAACLASADGLQRDPVLALRLIETALMHDLPVAASSRASIASASSDPAWCDRLRGSSEAGRCFLRLLDRSHRAASRADGASVSGTPDNARSVLADLHDLGLVLALIPEFAAVTARVQHDVYHVYTVDVHSVAAVDRLHALRRGELGPDFALASRLMASIDRREVLLLATLLHDVGKSHGRAHSKVGADMAPAIAARLGLDAEDAATVAWLVLEHLTLYHLATRRDLADPSTLAQVTTLVGDAWRLQALFLLTVADLSTTSPTAMTAWKARLLDELYTRAAEALQGEGHSAGRHREGLVARVLDLAGDAAPGVPGWVRAMPTRYLQASAPGEVLRHALALHDVAPGEPRLRLQPMGNSAGAGLYEVLVHAPDRPGLLSDLTALLFAHRLDIQRAEIHSVGSDVVDVFVVRHPDPTSRELVGLEARLGQQLHAVVEGRLDAESVVSVMRGGGGLLRPEPSVEARVALHNDVSDDATVIEVFGRDRPGFLHTVARAHHRLGLEIRVAKVNTEGRRAADVFYVTTAEGAKVPPGRYDEVRAALLQAVEAT
ncbi:MAG: [protein-PII] uridylyltransferase [Deltaproteobacteria bacterium]|nr:[protein-PII] uridylyltransferase [Deltaproteobacteria bacterium]